MHKYTQSQMKWKFIYITALLKWQLVLLTTSVMQPWQFYYELCQSHYSKQKDATSMSLTAHSPEEYSHPNTPQMLC